MFSMRYATLYIVAALTLLTGVLAINQLGWLLLCVPLALLTWVGLRDTTQTRHSIKRNYPLLAHFRFFFEFIRPEIRQYFLEDDNEERPFSRAQRSIVYQRAKEELDKRAFGTQLNLYQQNYEWINHSIAPKHVDNSNFRITIGGTQCLQPYSASVFNISAMSFGALSPNAIRALNKGAAQGGFYHDTGEGSVSVYHREFGGDLVWEIGSGYFGCRNPDGTFSPENFKKNAIEPQVKMIELKLSQGAKPGHGGVLPGAKVNAEIAAARGVKQGEDCISPASHSAFSTPLQMLEFLQNLRQWSGGKPVGFKFAVGHPWEFFAITKAMLESGITPDFIVVDGGEGGTGAAPVEFTDHVGTPLQEALLLVHNTLVGVNLRDQIKLGASGKIVTAFDIARTMALGADWCNSARGFMFALGCIQAQTCHTGTCPTGVTTQDPVRQRALVVPDKAQRVAHFHKNTLKALAELISAAGLEHPQDIKAHHIVRRVSQHEVRLVSTLFPFLRPGELLGADGPEYDARMNDKRFNVWNVYWSMANSHTFAPEHGYDILRQVKMS